MPQRLYFTLQHFKLYLIQYTTTHSQYPEFMNSISPTIDHDISSQAHCQTMDSEDDNHQAETRRKRACEEFNIFFFFYIEFNRGEGNWLPQTSPSVLASYIYMEIIVQP